MKKNIFLLTLSLSIISLTVNEILASQYEEVSLNFSENKQLTAPKTNNYVFSRVNHEGEVITDEDYYENNEYFRPEDDVAESKIEKGFYNFVDKVIINNKLNNYTSNIVK